MTVLVCHIHTGFLQGSRLWISTVYCPWVGSQIEVDELVTDGAGREDTEVGEEETDEAGRCVVHPGAIVLTLTGAL